MTPTTDSPYEPTSWLVVFHVKSGNPWLDRLIPGRFKHVSAMAWCEAARVWLFYDVTFSRTHVLALPDDAGTAQVAVVMRGATVLRMPVRRAATPSLPRFGLWCCTAVSHLLGIRGGALPDFVYRACLRSGATLVATGPADEGQLTTAARPDYGGAGGG